MMSLAGGELAGTSEISTFSGLVPGMYVGYDQASLVGNQLDYAGGSHLFIPWRRIEDKPRGIYDWSWIDEPLANLAPGKKAIIRIVLRCEDVRTKEGGMRDSCAPTWALNFDPIIEKNAPCSAPTKRINYLNPAVSQGLINLITAMGDRYRDDDRVTAVEIGVGYAGEPVPWPHTKTVCDRAQQEAAYSARPEYAEPGVAWSHYHERLIGAYADAFQGKKPLLTIISSSYAERYHGDVVRYAVSRNVGLILTSLHSDYNANRGSGEHVCYWGFITEPGFNDNSATADAAYLTQWAPLVVNKGRVPIGMEFNNRFDNTGRIPIEGGAFTRWAMLNALDKGADYVLPFNEGKGAPGNVQYKNVWKFYNRYVGRNANNTPDVWIAFRSPWKEESWCPDIYDYSWHLTSELETLPYADAKSQRIANAIDTATGVFDVGPQSNWRYYYARTTANVWPAFNLDIDDDFMYGGVNAVDVIVTYFDHDKGGKWALYYDSVQGEKLAGTVSLTGSNAWKTKTIHLSDARFSNHLKPISKSSRSQGFDLRLDRADGVDDTFNMVRVIRAADPPTPTPTPSPTSTATPSPTPSPTPTVTPTPSPTATATPTALPTATPTAAPTATPAPTATVTPTPKPTAIPTPTATSPPTCQLQLERNVSVGPHPKGVAAGPDGSLVGMQESSSLAIVTNDGRLRTIRTRGHGANAVVYSNTLAYMVHRNSANVSVIDPVTKSQIATISVGKLPWGAAANGKRLFVANFGDNTVSITDLSSNQVIATTGIHAMPALVAAGSDRAYIAHLDGYITVIGNNGALLDVFGPLPSHDAFGIALDEMHQRLFVSSRQGHEIVVLNSHTGKVMKRISVAPNIPYALAYAPDAALLYAIDAVHNQLLGIQPDRGEIFATLDVDRQNADHGGQALAVSADGNRLYVPAFDAGSLAIVHTTICP